MNQGGTGRQDRTGRGGEGNGGDGDEMVHSGEKTLKIIQPAQRAHSPSVRVRVRVRVGVKARVSVKVRMRTNVSSFTVAKKAAFILAQDTIALTYA